MDCGVSHCYALVEGGRVWSAGYNDKGQLGIGEFSTELQSSWVETDIESVQDVSAGYHFGFVLLNNGEVSDRA